MRKFCLVLATGGLLLAAVPAQGQVAWDSPLLLSPESPAGVAVFLTDPWPGGGIGFLATWKGTGNLGFRGGVAEGWMGDLAVYGGMDASGRLVTRSDEFPLDVDWVTGVGLGIGEAALLSAPLGVSIGRGIQADDVWFNPYFAPRVVLDAWLGSDRPRDGLELNLAVDLGIDVAFQPDWTIRFGATLGDREALVIGMGFRGP